MITLDIIKSPEEYLLGQQTFGFNHLLFGTHRASDFFSPYFLPLELRIESDGIRMTSKQHLDVLINKKKFLLPAILKIGDIVELQFLSFKIISFKSTEAFLKPPTKTIIQDKINNDPKWEDLLNQYQSLVRQIIDSQLGPPQ
jgi:hypothetical protein